MEIRRKNSILVIVRAPWIVREVESYALSKFQPPTMLGDLQTIEKTMVRWALKKQFFIIVGRTELTISLSGTKCHEEADFDV